MQDLEIALRCYCLKNKVSYWETLLPKEPTTNVVVYWNIESQSRISKYQNMLKIPEIPRIPDLSLSKAWIAIFWFLKKTLKQKRTHSAWPTLM